MGDNMQEPQACQILLEISYEAPVENTMMKLVSGETYSLPKDCKLPITFQGTAEQRFGDNVLIYRNLENEFEYYRLSITCPAYASYCQDNPIGLVEGKRIPIHYKSTNIGYRRDYDLEEIIQRVMPIIENKSYLVATNKNLHVMSFDDYNVEPEPFRGQ